jgi:beta-glucanase (GH16 family)
MKPLITLFSFIIIINEIPTQIAALQDKAEIPIQMKNYSLQWNDEFEGAKLNINKWNYRSLGKRGDAINSKDAIHLDGKGNLVIEARELGGNLIAGIIDTENKFATKFGYFECKAKLTRVKGIWPAFWLQSSTNIENGSPDKSGAEIDIFEYFKHEKLDSVSHTLHWGGYGKTHKKAGPVYGALQKTKDGFHVFGLEWTPNSYTTFVDGKATYIAKTNISQVPEFIVLSLEINREVAGILNKTELPDQYIIDYVRVYKKNGQ